MYKIIIENILGINIKGEGMSIKPVLPLDMYPYKAVYRHRSNGCETLYNITVSSDDIKGYVLDGKYIQENEIKLISDGGSHDIVTGN